MARILLVEDDALVRKSTNKVLRNFQARGLIRMDGQTLTVLRPDLLRQRVAYQIGGEEG